MICSTSYRENSILAIARVAVTHNLLSQLYTTLYTARFQKSIEWLPSIGTRLAAEFGRRAYPGIPKELVTSLTVLPELVHVGVRRFLGSHLQALATGRMYAVKAHFDKAVARRLKKYPADVLVGMYCASLESFRAIHEHDGIMGVLNFVNSHPVEQNRYLAEYAGLATTHHEMIPPWVAGRVEAELALADLGWCRRVLSHVSCWRMVWQPTRSPCCHMVWTCGRFSHDRGRSRTNAQWNACMSARFRIARVCECSWMPRGIAASCRCAFV